MKHNVINYIVKKKRRRRKTKAGGYYTRIHLREKKYPKTEGNQVINIVNA